MLDSSCTNIPSFSHFWFLSMTWEICCWTFPFPSSFLNTGKYRKYLEKSCVWVESNLVATLNIMSSIAEVGLGFFLILSLFSLVHICHLNYFLVFFLYDFQLLVKNTIYYAGGNVTLYRQSCIGRSVMFPFHYVLSDPYFVLYYYNSKN